MRLSRSRHSRGPTRRIARPSHIPARLHSCRSVPSAQQLQQRCWLPHAAWLPPSPQAAARRGRMRGSCRLLQVRVRSSWRRSRGSRQLRGRRHLRWPRRTRLPMRLSRSRHSRGPTRRIARPPHIRTRLRRGVRTALRLERQRLLATTPLPPPQAAGLRQGARLLLSACVARSLDRRSWARRRSGGGALRMSRAKLLSAPGPPSACTRACGEARLIWVGLRRTLCSLRCLVVGATPIDCIVPTRVAPVLPPSPALAT